MCSERRFYCTCCCTSNTTAAKSFAITYLVILGIMGIAGFLQLLPIWHSFMLGFFTYWLILSILVVIGTNGQYHGLLLVISVLGWLGILNFAAYLFCYYGSYYNYYIEAGEAWIDTNEAWELALGCVGLFVLVWYVLCIHGAMLEARETNIPIDGPSGVEMGHSVQGQQVYPTPESSDSPPSYYELFPPMEQSSK